MTNIEKILTGALVVFGVFLFLISEDLNGLKTYVLKGGMFAHENVMVGLKDISWANLPIELREGIASKYRSTKLNKKDLEELVALYTKLRNEYTEPIVIAK